MLRADPQVDRVYYDFYELLIRIYLCLSEYDKMVLYTKMKTKYLIIGNEVKQNTRNAYIGYYTYTGYYTGSEKSLFPGRETLVNI